MICPLLAIETSGKSLGVALRTESGLAFEENVQAGAVHGKSLAPLIRKALESQRLKAAQLGGIAVSLGPGSWTGLRIGLSAAKALAWGAGVPLIGVPSFDALARDASRHAPNHARLVLRDARSEGFFLALFSERSPHAERWIPESVLKVPALLAEVESTLPRHGDVPLALCGDGVCLDALAGTAQQLGWTLLRGCEHISAAAVAECGWDKLVRGEVLRETSAIHALAPLYLRASDPELKLGRRVSVLVAGTPDRIKP